MEIDNEQDGEGGSYEAYFRDPSLASDSPLAWAIAQRVSTLDALRGLFSGSSAVVQLRMWCFMELASVPHGHVSREQLNLLFHALQPQVLDSVLKRFRDVDLLVWDATSQDYSLSSLARQLHSLLAPLTKSEISEDDDLGPLLAQVAGAHALGLAEPSQLRHLHAQLARLHDDFADAIASGSEAKLRQAKPRFERALLLVDRAGHALTALIRSESEDPRLEKEARVLGFAQAKLLSMASQFNRAMQQVDRQRVTLGSTGVTSSDVRRWLQDQTDLHALCAGVLSTGVQPVFVAQQDLLDVAEAEFERDRPNPDRSTGLPPANLAASGDLDVPKLPPELDALIGLLQERLQTPDWVAPNPVPFHDAVLGGRFAQAAYRMQLLPLLGDAQAKTLKGQTGDLARSGWSTHFNPNHSATSDPHVMAMSDGQLEPIVKEDDESTR